MIETRGLSKRYGDVHAVADLDLTVRPGIIYGFLGPNGAGKTTTMRLLTGLLRPSSGTASIAGVDVATDPIAVKSIVGHLPDNPFLYDHLSVTEWLTFVGDVYRIPDARVRELGDRYLSLFELSDQSGKRCGELSFGMRKKVAIAGILIRQPKVLLLDEPTSGLDPRAVKALRDLLQELAREGATVFFSTHILEVAQRISHEVGIVARGRLVASGTVESLREKAHASQSDLEEIFLSLTESESETAPQR